MSDDRARLIDRIKKLMALGESSSFEEEARTSLHKAFKLMKEHNITLADVAGLERDFTDEEIQEVATAAIYVRMREIGRNGGLKGGPARARKLSAKRRSAIAKKAGQASGEARRRKMQEQ